MRNEVEHDTELETVEPLGVVIFVEHEDEIGRDEKEDQSVGESHFVIVTID